MGKYLKGSTSYESTYGNGSAMLAAGVFKGIRVKSISYPVDRSPMKEENIESSIPGAAYGGTLKISGSIEANLRPKQQTMLMYCLFGASAALSGSDYITSGTKFTLGNPVSMQLKIGENTTAATTDMELGYMGAAIKSMTINITAGEIVTAKYDWFAKLYTGASPYSAPADPGDYVVEDPLVFYNATVSLAGAASSTKIKSMSISIDRKVADDRFVIGDYTLQEIGVNGMTEVTGDITFTEKEYAEFKRALFGATGANALECQNLLGTPSFLLLMHNIAVCASEVAKMYVYFGGIVFGSTDVTISGQNEVEKKVSYSAVGTADTGFVIGIAA